VGEFQHFLDADPGVSQHFHRRHPILRGDQALADPEQLRRAGTGRDGDGPKDHDALTSVRRQGRPSVSVNGICAAAHLAMSMGVAPTRVGRVEYATRESLAADLRELGVVPGGVVVLHSAYKSLGFVVGGPQAVVEALLAVVGTLVVPTHTSDNSDPAGWSNPPVPSSWWAAIRSEAPGFDVALTPASQWMGRLSELVRTWPGAARSDHPEVSFAAVGARAAEIVGGHERADGLGEASPLGAVHRLDGQILLLGCGHDANTSMHLAECRIAGAPRHVAGGSVRGTDGVGRWETWSEVAVDSGDFEQIGAAFEQAGHVTVGPVGKATARLMSQRATVDFARYWIMRNRPGWGAAGTP
jgi:aminoglycoside 3-N-acetyltransferase